MQKQLEELIDYKFRDSNLLEEALTHASLQSKNKKNMDFNNERLEFLGDSVLGMVVTEMLIKKYKLANEGELAKKKASLVCKESLANIADKICLGNYIKMSEIDKCSGLNLKKATLENAFEALIGAIYLDGGFEKAKKFIYKYFYHAIGNLKEVETDPKSALQEWAQKRGKSIPIYELIDQTGPSHSPIFKIKVIVEDVEPVEATGESKKIAERNAAIKLLKERINNK